MVSLDSSGVGPTWWVTSATVDPALEGVATISFDQPSGAWRPVAVPGNAVRQGIVADGRSTVWYRRQILLGKDVRRSLAVRLGEVSDRDRVYFNGQLIGSTGQWDAPRPQAYDRHRIYPIPPDVVRPGRANVILVQVQGYFPQDLGLQRDRTEIGPAEAIWRRYYFENTLGVVLLATYVPVALYFLLLYLRSGHGIVNLLFALYTLGLVAYQFLRTQLKYELGFSFYALKKIEYVLLFLLVPLFYQFIRSFFDVKPSRLWTWFGRIARTLQGAIALGALFVLATDSAIAWNELNRSGIQPIWAIFFIMILGLLLHKSLAGNRDARLMLGGFGVFLTCIILDIGSSRGLVNLPRVAPYGFLIFILGLAAILSNRYAETMNEQAEAQRMTALGRVASGIIHDLKNPMGLIKGYAELAADEDFSREEQKEFLDTISIEIDRLSGMVQDVLDFTRGTLRLDRSETNVSAYLSEIKSFLDPVLTQRNIQLECVAADDSVLRLDRARFRRVILNLAGNAADAMNNGGTFSIVTERRDTLLRLAFSDTGPGIPPEWQPRLFEAFATTKSTGTGLGLAVARRIVEEHGGSIRYEPFPGGGARFVVELPTEESAA